MNSIPSKFQLKLYGFNDYIKNFISLFNKGRLPNTILLSGPKGLGKSTFVYHFANYLFSHNEDNAYDLNKFIINSENSNFKLICDNIHPNFYLLEQNLANDNIKIDEVRSLIKFLNKTSYSKNIKIILIDSSEYLNVNSSNALLKALEEPSPNTFFFIIHDSSSKILNTIKSRCVETKFFFNLEKKKYIFTKITQDYDLNYDDDEVDKILLYETPGNLLKYLLLFKEANINIFDDKLSCIKYLLEKYKSRKDNELLNIASFFIENFYNELSLQNNDNLNNYFINKYKSLNLINDMKKFNLDKKSLLISLNNIFQNEKR